jgi:hypothetical protein
VPCLDEGVSAGCKAGLAHLRWPAFVAVIDVRAYCCEERRHVRAQRASNTKAV